MIDEESSEIQPPKKALLELPALWKLKKYEERASSTPRKYNFLCDTDKIKSSNEKGGPVKIRQRSRSETDIKQYGNGNNNNQICKTPLLASKPSNCSFSSINYETDTASSTSINQEFIPLPDKNSSFQSDNDLTNFPDNSSMLFINRNNSLYPNKTAQRHKIRETYKGLLAGNTYRQAVVNTPVANEKINLTSMNSQTGSVIECQEQSSPKSEIAGEDSRQVQESKSNMQQLNESYVSVSSPISQADNNQTNPAPLNIITESQIDDSGVGGVAKDETNSLLPSPPVAANSASENTSNTNTTSLDEKSRKNKRSSKSKIFIEKTLKLMETFEKPSEKMTSLSIKIEPLTGAKSHKAPLNSTAKLQKCFGEFYCRQCDLSWCNKSVWVIQGTRKVVSSKACNECENEVSPWYLSYLSC